MKNERIILISGANRGIGLAIAQELSLDQSNTILLGVRAPESISKLEVLNRNNTRLVKLDLSSVEVLKHDILAIKDDYPVIDVLINNAGVLCEGDFNSFDINEFQNSIQVNSLAPAILISEFYSGMNEKGYGRIVNISSGWGSFNEGLDGPFSYSVSKATLNAITKSVSNKSHPNVKVNSMCPGWVRTRMGGDQAPRTTQEGAKCAVWLANLPDNGPSGKFFRDNKPISW